MKHKKKKKGWKIYKEGWKKYIGNVKKFQKPVSVNSEREER